MAILQGKRYRFASDPEVAPASDELAPAPRSGRIVGKLKRNAALGLMLAAPLFVFSVYHPTNQSVNPISRATAAVEAGAVNAEQTALVVASSRIKGLSRIEATVDADSGELRELYGVGSLDGTEPSLRLDIRSHAAEGKKVFFAWEIADSIERMGATIRKFGRGQTLATPRGTLEFTEMTLAASTGPKTCLAFRVAPSDDKRLAGFLCGPNGMKPDVAALPCVVERLEFSKGAQTAGFGNLLRGQPGSRAACRSSVI